MSTIHKVFQSRWGYHPCDYETFRKLKFLHGIHQGAVRMAHAWTRWHRKDPHNRVIRRRIRNEKGQAIGYMEPVSLPEPRICPVFLSKVQEKRYRDKRGTDYPNGFMDEKVVIYDAPIVADYRAARRPMPSPDAVVALRLSLEEIEQLYQRARDWESGI